MWKESLRRWSQTAYGLIHSVNITCRSELADVDGVGNSITDSFGWLTRHDQFASSVELRDSSSEDFRLSKSDVQGVMENLKSNLLGLLFVDLAVLTDELLASIMTSNNVDPIRYPYLGDKVKAVRCDMTEVWARTGVLELNVIRNCLVHSDGRWSKRGLNDIRKLTTNVAAQEGDEVAINYEDLFRYKRAVRTLLNQAEANGFMS